MSFRSRLPTLGALVLILVALTALAPTAANAADSFPSDSAKPDLVVLLSGFADYWRAGDSGVFQGTVLNADVLARNDEIVTWVNNHATAKQRTAALQDSKYDRGGESYDQSVTIGTGLGSALGPIYIAGRRNGSLPLTDALLSSENGTSGAYVSTDLAKYSYNFPRPFVPSSPSAPPLATTSADCSPALVNAESLLGFRVGEPYADANGSLRIRPVSPIVDDSGLFTSKTIPLDAEYDGLCRSPGFPSGHTTSAYQAAIALATLLPEFAPEILARASENGNNRMVLGVHSPLDIMGGRISGEAGIAARWSDEKYREEVLKPARAELVAYLEKRCGVTIVACAASGASYSSDPYGGAVMPGGSDQTVSDRASAVAVYRERLTYALPKSGQTGLDPAVPAGAANLLLTPYPTLTDAQRTSVLAQTEIESGHPLDRTQSGQGSWQRLDLASAMSASVLVNSDGSVSVQSTGGSPVVALAPGATPAPTTFSGPDFDVAPATDFLLWPLAIVLVLVGGTCAIVIIVARRSMQSRGVEAGRGRRRAP